MAVPKKRRSHTRRAKRRSHMALEKSDVKTCPECGIAVLPHRVCNEKRFDCALYENKEATT